MASLPMGTVKPSRLARDVANWTRRRKQAVLKHQAARQAANRWRAISALVKSRDGGRCRVCGVQTMTAGDPRLIGATHHIVYRSAGGTDDLSNLIHTCAQCHDDEHRHVIEITGTADDLQVRR